MNKRVYALIVCSFFTGPLHSNPVLDENLRQGTKNWYLKNPSRAHEIEGFASATSINIGDTIDIKVNTSAANYTWELFRLGWYEGVGARKIQPTGKEQGAWQPSCEIDKATNQVECPWSTSFSMVAQSHWVSGAYVIRLTETKTNTDSFVLFVVRDDRRASDIVYAHSVTTDLAYNPWGGHHSYNGAFKVSLNRPVLPPPYAKEQNPVGTGYFFAYYDYNLLLWLEKNGYDVKYVTNLDVHEDYERFSSSRVFLSVGHDEYWSRTMRNNVVKYRDEGKSILFLSSNSMYWQVRFEPDAQGNPNRVMACYKNEAADPENQPSLKTVRFRDAPVFEPEDDLLGVLMDADFPKDDDLTIRDASHWVFTETGLNDGDTLRGMLGFEVDRMHWSAPKSIERLGVSKFRGPQGGPSYSDMILYRTPQGGLVFNPGSMQWIWGLNDLKIWNSQKRGFENKAVQSITRNVLSAILNSSKVIKPYPNDELLLDLRFKDAPFSTHFKDDSPYERSVLCMAPNCPDLTPDSRGGLALNFTQESQFVDLGVETSIRGSKAFTVEFAMRVGPHLKERVVMQQRDDRSSRAYSGHEGSYRISIEPSGRLTFWTFSKDHGHSIQMQSQMVVTDMKWHKLSVSRLDDGAGVIVIDGREDAKKTASTVDVLKPHTVFLGRDPLAAGLGFVGQIEYLKIKAD